VAFAAVVPYGSLINDNSVSGAFGLLPLKHLEHWRIISVASHNLRPLVAVGAVLAGLFLFVLPRRWALAAPLAVLAYFALASHPVYIITQQASADSAHAGITVRRDWIDHTVGGNAKVPILFFALNAVPFWQNEFFNASVRTVYTIPGRYDGLPQTQVGVYARTGDVIDPVHNRRLHDRYLLVNQTLFPVGRLLAEDPGTGMRLYRITGPSVRLRYVINWIYPDDWSGGSLQYTRYRCRGGTLTTVLSSNPLVHPHDQVVTATLDGRVVTRRVIRPAHDTGQRMNVPLTGKGGLCSVTFTITPTAQPNVALHNGDMRELGVRFTNFVFRPRG